MESFQKKLGRLLLYADPEGLTIVGEVLLSRKWNGLSLEQRFLDAFVFIVCFILLGLRDCYVCRCLN